MRSAVLACGAMQPLQPGAVDLQMNILQECHLGGGSARQEKLQIYLQEAVFLGTKWIRYRCVRRVARVAARVAAGRLLFALMPRSTFVSAAGHGL
jgi:hypothetical protein